MQRIFIENFVHLSSRPLKVYYYHSTEFTVFNPTVVIPNLAATSMYSEVHGQAKKLNVNFMSIQISFGLIFLALPPMEVAN